MVQPPRRSLIVWMTQRVGSSMLCQTLEETGLVGRPGESLNADDADSVLEKHGVRTIHELREKLWSDEETPNGIVGLKYGLVAYRHAAFTEAFRVLVDSAEPDEQTIWSAMFPRARHVFLTRRNKVALAVSWLRAIRTGRGHRRVDEPPLEPVSDDAYDYDAIAHLLVEANLREAATQGLFQAWGVVPLTVVYEDMIADYDATVRRVLEHAQVEPPRVIPSPTYVRLADDMSERWIQRFRLESQAQYERPVW